MNNNFNGSMDTLFAIFNSMPSKIFFEDTNLNCVFSTKGAESFIDESDREIIENGDAKHYTVDIDDFGETKAIDIIKRPVRDDNGNIIGVLGIISDVSLITEALKNKYETSTKETELFSKIKSSFIDNISREARNPLGNIIATNDQILRDTEDEKIVESSKAIRHSCNKLLTLINELSDFSKIASGKLEIVPSNYMFSDFIREITSSVKLKAYKKFLSFKEEIDFDIPVELFGDSQRITQVLNSLLANAIKYTEKGTVSLKATLVEKHNETCKIKYEVIDTGIGFDEPLSSFDNIEEIRYREGHGIGLGITISNHLLNQMGSKLEVESTMGEGSNFSFVLEQKIINNTTLEEKAKQDEENKASEAFIAPDAEILVVDDVLVNLKVAQGLLGMLDMKIDIALSGNEAIEKCKEKKYNLIFMDYMMPEMNGTEAMHHIKDEIDGYKDVPVIALTADALTEAKEQLLADGFNDFVQKPIDVQFITEKVKQWLPNELIKAKPKTNEDEENN